MSVGYTERLGNLRVENIKTEVERIGIDQQFDRMFKVLEDINMEDPLWVSVKKKQFR